MNQKVYIRIDNGVNRICHSCGTKLKPVTGGLYGYGCNECGIFYDYLMRPIPEIRYSNKVTHYQKEV